MKWKRATAGPRLICLTLGVCGIGMAWRLTQIGAAGIEDVPPPFILLSGLAGLGFLCLAAINRYPRPGA
jgi:hypothetical protein